MCLQRCAQWTVGRTVCVWVVHAAVKRAGQGRHVISASVVPCV